MPCLVITGYPSSGKTSIAQALSERALKHRSQSIKKTVIINEESIFSSSSALSQQNTAGKANETRYYCYKDSNAEKQTRSALKTEFDKQAATASSTNTLVILDSLNYIKGYRYELHCISKAAGERHGILWVVCPPGVALEWNKKRIQEDLEKPKEGNANESNDDDEKQHRLYYSEEMMEGLMKRYEPPDQRNRWDKPLYRVELAALLPELASSSSTQTESNGNDSTANTIAKDVLAKSVYNMHSLSDAIDKSSPTEKQTKQKLPSSSNESNGDKDRTPLEVKLDEILDAFLESRPLKEGMSTQKPVVAESNVLHKVDSITKKLTTSILQAQQQVAPGGKLSVIPQSKKTISFPRKVNLPELRRQQRQYVKWASSHPPDNTTEIGVSISFLDYLETQMK